MNQKFRRITNKFTIENLTAYLVIMTAVVSFISSQTTMSLGDISGDTLLSSEWWQIFFYPFRINAGGILFLLLFLYVFWIFGSMLEMSVGSTRYTHFIFTGLALMLGGTILLPIRIDPSLLYLSIFLAVAILHPDHTIYLFFILPIKIKWLAMLSFAFVLYYSITALIGTWNFLYIAGPLLGLGNVLLFFHRDLRGHLRGSPIKGGLRKFEFQQKAAPVQQTIHRCTVCGRTEADDPHLEFRYCNECDDHEYCMDHLYNHEHIKEGSQS